MAFPAVRSSRLTIQSSNSTSWTLIFPFEAGDIKDGGSDYVLAGDLIMVNVGQDGSGGSGAITDFTQKFSASDGAACRGVTLVKVATGSEGNLTYSPGANEQGVARVVVFKNWYGALTGVEVSSSTGNTGTSANPDPDSITPSWGSADTYYRAVAAHDDGTNVITGYPTNFTDNQNADASGGGTGAGLGSAGYQSTTSPMNPSTFTIDASEQWVSWTIAIRPNVSITVTPSPVTAALGVVAVTQNRTLAPAAVAVPAGVVQPIAWYAPSDAEVLAPVLRATIPWGLR